MNHVPGTRFELVTRGFSVLCSTSWAIPTIPNVTLTSHPHFIRWLGSMSIKKDKGGLQSFLQVLEFLGSSKTTLSISVWVMILTVNHSNGDSLLNLDVYYISHVRRENHLRSNTFIEWMKKDKEFGTANEKG